MSTLFSTLLLVVLSCGKNPKYTKVPMEQLHLQAPPAMVARLEYVGPDRTYRGPARMEVEYEKEDQPLPLKLKVEDYALAELIEARVISTSPVAFGQVAGNMWRDKGSFLRDQDRLIVNFTRTWEKGNPAADASAGPPPHEAKITILGNMAPEPQRPPKDWLRPGTVLYYGITYDDKPITKLVPMGLNVTIVQNDEQRVFDWYRDLDPATLQNVTGELSLSGRRTIPAEVANSAGQHGDIFERGDDTASMTSIFIPRVTRKNLSAFGAAAWEDVEAGQAGLLEAIGSVDARIQADDVIWEIPSTVARSSSGSAVYVIADNETDPILLSAARPRYKVKLMAIGRPR